MEIVKALVLLLSLFFIFATFVSLIRWEYWWIRIFDYPRLQISIFLVLLAIGCYLIYDFSKVWQYLLMGMLLISILYQVRKIYRYSIFAKKQVLSYTGDETENTFSLIVSNVYQSNRKTEKLIELVDEYKPDLLLCLETNKWWEEQLKVIEKDYPYTIKKPLENLYGMHLYSKIELGDPRINFLFEEDIPSFEAWLQLNSKDKFKIFCLHPKPPFPTESKTSTKRDAELLIVGKEMVKKNMPVLIFGDFNDVAWSNTTRLFQKVSKLLDPRIGRGFFNTFHARYPFFRWSLDHVFHSSHFQLIELKRLKYIGSDHFPIFIKLHYKPEEKKKHEEPDAEEEDYRQAQEKIVKAEMDGEN